VTDAELTAEAIKHGWQARTTARATGYSCTGSFRERMKRLQAKAAESSPAPVSAPLPSVEGGDKLGSNSAVPAWQGYKPRAGWTAPEATERARASREEVRRVAVIPDTHVPFHDRQAWAVALSVVREWAPHRVVLIGDFMDTEAVSRHGKNTPDTVRLAEEYHETNLRLDELQETAPDATWLYLEGNHEARVSKWCAEFGSMDGLLDPAEALYMKPRDEGYHRSTSLLRGMEWIPLSRQPFQIDGCAYLHGVYENQHHAAFHALHLGPEIGCKEIRFGHMHTLQSAISPAGYHAACVGFLGDKTQRAFKYKRGKPAPWALGLVLQEIGGGLVTDTQVRIVNGRALVSGNVIEARAA
jgi:hypothetical protein